ncbi:hypothetical protein ILUMI_21428 [Ignelater luminosus]|uniref:Reverse transcriptase domain-containing protein n=1 Tax=Ignelater luminosus TaxID=2038154 RepID=A0A8K0CCG9_IGNLU|nr:hypothetical protein ILUMI_21428 [Ignelater luminosus]
MYGEVTKAQKYLKNGKSAGEDGIKSERLKHLGQEGIRRLHELIVKIHENQAGFRQGRGTQDWIFGMRQISEKVMIEEDRVYMCGIDVENAYDTLSRELGIVWKTTVLQQDYRKLSKIYIETQQI